MAATGAAQVATEARVRSEYGLQWLVLGVPRLHYTVATLDVTSKTGGGRHALEVAPEQWHVRRAGRDGAPGRPASTVARTGGRAVA